MSLGMDPERLRKAMGQIAARRETGKPATAGKRGRPAQHSGCKRTGCARPHHSGGLCKKHYAALRRLVQRMAGKEGKAQLAARDAEITALRDAVRAADEGLMYFGRVRGGFHEAWRTRPEVCRALGKEF